jgi:hypothetical protein
MHRAVRFAVAGICSLLSLTAAAGESISTDRPDFVESSSTVGRERVQIETSLSWERTREPGGVTTRTRTTPTLLRLGVSETLELRVESDGFVRDTRNDPALGATQREHGFSDAALGVKWHMQDGDDKTGVPGIAWLAHMELPSGSSAFQGHGLRPSLRAVAEWELPHDFSFGVMPGLMVDTGPDGKRFTGGIFAATVGKSWTAAWRTFIEVAGRQLAARRHGGSVVTFDAGTTYLVTDDLQLDFSMARGLSSAAPDLQWGIGISVRF